MVRAIFQTQRWICARPPQEIATTIAPFFPTLERGVLAASIARYKEQLIWGCDPILPADGFYRLQRALVSSGFIRRAADYEACVDNTLAQRVIAERAGG
jgi:NitT/TauT family transport system substrate-binding protein